MGPFGAEDSQIHALHGLNVFYRARATEPSAAKAAWLIGRLYEFLRWSSRPAGLKGVFRPDIYRRALRLVPREVNARPKAKKVEIAHAGRPSSRAQAATI